MPRFPLLALTITIRKAGSVTIASLVGRITIGVGSVTLRETFHELAAGDNPSVVLDMSGVSNIDSSGIGELVAGFTSARTQGRTLKLLSLSKRVEDLLQMTGVYRIFEVYRDEARAIRSFE